MPTGTAHGRRRTCGASGRSWRRVLLAACVAAGTTLGLMVTGPAQAATARGAADEVPEFAEQVLYQAGTGGYSCFRIPAIVTTNDGTLLAFAEGRVRTCSDTGDIDLVLRRSHDGGRTWGPLQVLIQGDGDTRGNPVPIVDRESGRIVVLSTYNPGENQQVRHPFVQYSEDDGATWTPPRDVTAQISRPEWEWWYGTGPVHGIQLRRGPHAGRMVVPAYFNESGGSPGGVVLALSDDGGLTWRRGAVDRRDSPTMIPGENSVVELTDGRIYDSAREGGVDPDPGNRAFAISSDGGETFDAPFVTDPRIEVPTVQGALLRLSATDEGDTGNRLLFAAPAHPAAREVMTIRSSHDEAESWDTWEQGKVIHWGPSAYSDLTEPSPGVVGLVYEAGDFSPYEEIRFARMNEAYLDTPNATPPGIPGPPAPGPTTPNLATGGHRLGDGPMATGIPTAYVRGGAGLTAGRFGKALNLDGADDRVEVPYEESIDLGAGDFTWSTWFRYTATSGTHTLGWAYRLGPNTTPQVWFRAEPGSNRMRALLGTGYGTATLTAAGAYNDGGWHQVVLQRVGRRFLMWMDGAQVAAVASPAGSVTEGKEFGVQGIHIGERVDGTSRFHGSLDDVRVYRRALAPAEITRLYEHNLSGRRDLALWLPFERIDPN